MLVSRDDCRWCTRPQQDEPGYAIQPITIEISYQCALYATCNDVTSAAIVVSLLLNENIVSTHFVPSNRFSSARASRNDLLHDAIRRYSRDAILLDVVRSTCSERCLRTSVSGVSGEFCAQLWSVLKDRERTGAHSFGFTACEECTRMHTQHPFHTVRIIVLGWRQMGASFRHTLWTTSNSVVSREYPL